MKITWIGHSCFRIEKGEYRVILDPYEDGSVPGLSPVRESANVVLCSHEHGDHNARQLVSLEKEAKSVIAVSRIHTYHDDEKGAKRGKNIIHILDDGEFRIAHFGDLGCRLEAEQAKQLKNLDAALIPIGGFYTIDAKAAAELVKQIAPRIVIPMHYRDDEKGFGFPVISTLEPFLKRMETVEVFNGSTLDLAAGNGKKETVVVLRPQNVR